MKSVFKKNLIFKMIIAFFSVIFIMTGLLCIVSLIPNSAVQETQEEGLEILNSEGTYPSYFFNTYASTSDNFTDAIIIEHLLNDMNDTILEAAMHKTYARYWFGTVTFLRPLSMFLTFYQIRYFLMVLTFLLFGCTAATVTKKLGFSVSIPFMIAFTMTYLNIQATSLQFTPVLLISLLSVIMVLSCSKTLSGNELLFFMIVGMVTNYLDLLTVPLITLGLPLIVCVLNNRSIYDGKNLSRVTGFSAIAWVLGYGFTWASKWILGTLILKENVIADANQVIAFRTMGNEQFPLNRGDALKSNITTMFFPNGEKTTFLIIYLVIVVMLALLMVFLFRKRDRIENCIYICIAFIGLLPYVWYLVLANHSAIHFPFTYRAQVVTVFAFLTIVFGYIDWKRLYNRKGLKE